MKRYDKIIFDFDDTLWSRNPKDIDCSIYNVKFIKEHLSDKAIIVSGNSFTSIKDKLDAVDLVLPEIWADANSILYKNGIFSNVLSGCSITDSALKFNDYVIKNNFLDKRIPILVGTEDIITNIKLKPFGLDRDIYLNKINNLLKELNLTDCIAKATGRTTIDILSIYNSKILVYNFLELYKYKTLYIGDEVDKGNDKDIANLCTRKIRVNNIYDTKVLLDCFGDNI